MLIVVFFGCKKDSNSLNTTVTPVATFFAPKDSSFYDLASTSSVQFEWDQSLAADGNLVMYIIAFDKKDGDFSSPLYSIASDGNGLYNRATLSKDVLNKICKLAGVEPSASGTLKWTVYATKGVNKVKSTISRYITLQRPFGLDNPPVDVYLTGSATEGGTDITKAIKLKQTSSGKYEIYTSLKSGAYHFVDKTTGATINGYYLNGNAIKEGGDSTKVSTVGTYRISLDFNVLTSTITTIKKIDFWYCSLSAFKGSFNYTSNGVWEMKNYTVVPTNMGGWTDTRYKFRVVVNNGTSDAEEWWGNSDHEGGNPPTASSPQSFYYLFPADNNQWNYGFKFADAATNKSVDLQLIFSPSVANYTHSVTIH